jgi:hypothetical protein
MTLYTCYISDYTADKLEQEINKKNAAASGKRGVRLRIFQQKNDQLIYTSLFQG